MTTVATLLLLLMLARFVYAIYAGVQHGLRKKRMTKWGLREPEVLEGDAAVKYGWSSIAGGAVLTVLVVWALWALRAD